MIIDTSALVAILFREPERDRFIRLIASTGRKMSAAGVIELSMILAREFGSDAGIECDHFLLAFRIYVESVTPEQARVARDAFLQYGKGRHSASLNFGDCFSYALAKATGEPLLFKGDDFSKTDLISAS